MTVIGEKYNNLQLSRILRNRVTMGIHKVFSNDHFGSAAEVERLESRLLDIKCCIRLMSSHSEYYDTGASIIESESALNL